MNLSLRPRSDKTTRPPRLHPADVDPAAVRECHDSRSDWCAEPVQGELDPTPVGDLEAWQAGYDPVAAGALDRLLGEAFGPLGGVR